ncbi:MAG: 3-deoxy-D-manno-octulosonic acid kinase [Gammaproteobacteria bacterium]|nr:3-deoxy-D-manno-octulosonic acid kinase [Gammaproteobacteria bacterium]NNF61441.1 3-deoxy-D-manno-octulosonic acid kinase [Gammaproteobacteria bacterium]NNM20184.1 3-deoxy-D-manno-octulosonic acid kinase [Gammaproteobacteria bacterium]
MTATINAVQPDRFDGRVIVDARYENDFVGAMFTPEYWRTRESVAAPLGGRGQVLFVNSGSEQWVLRHYHRGGLVRRVLDDRYLWTGIEQTRSLREWRLLAQLHGQGLPVPRPVAARHVRDGMFYRADLLTVRIPDVKALSEVVAERLPGDDEWHTIGSCLRRLHDAGVYHADLNAHNILVNETGSEVFVVDFDRGYIRRDGSWRKANLKRLNRSLHKIGLSLSFPQFEQQQWPALLEGYAAE